jgi:DNA-directed RNA polymerase II subunit RPB2
MYRNLLELYFGQHNNRQIVYHQISSFNHFMDTEVPQTILRSCPIRVTGSPDLNLTGTTRAAAGTAGTAIRVSIEQADEGQSKKPAEPTHPREVEVCVEFANVQLRKPTIFENNGAVTPMYPNDARLRNLTYAAPVYTDIIATFTMRTPNPAGGEPAIEVRRRTLPHVHVGRIPVMVGSKYCILYDTPEKTPREMGECSEDVGGYFIVQGGERVMISQERMAENMPFVFRNNKVRNKEMEVIDIKSIGPDNEGSPKSMSVKIVCHTKNSIAPEHIRITCPRIKAEIPLFIMMRALGICSDKEIIEIICGSVDNPYSMIFQECIEDAGDITTTEKAHEWLAANLGNGGGSRESYSTNTLHSAKPSRITTIKEVLAEECLPHIGGGSMLYEKACYIAFITKKVLDVFRGKVPHDDRDAYPNKKVELPGNLMGNLFRYLFGTKVIKDMKTTLTKEIHNGFWKSSGKIEDIINPSNVYKILKSTIVTIGMKSSLATGNFVGGKMGNKQGISQVMNRLTYLSGISHLRRVSTPIEKTGKLLAPRKLHASQYGYVCPAETPEGHAVGVVKNLSSTALVSLPMSPEPVVDFLYSVIGMKNLEEIPRSAFVEHAKLFINGAWVGMIVGSAKEIRDNVETLRCAKRRGRIHIHTSINYKIERREIWINTEGGRLIRPVLNAAAMREILAFPLCAPEWISGSSSKACASTSWNDVLRWKSPGDHNLIEYIDPNETENAYIAMTIEDFSTAGRSMDFTHMEIHPCVALGTMASNIPFPDHNQAPRNCYQCAMGKQAMGVYALNFDERLDTMSNLLWYSSVPLASPYMSRFYRAQSMPSGFNIVVAIMTYGGYNQEDSIMINRASLERGLFRSEFYRTYKDEEKKNQASGEEERFCRPNPLTTRHMKLACYDKLGADGIVPENTYVTQEDVLIGKVAPIRLRAADGAAIAGINHASLQAMSSVAAAAAVEAAGGKRFRDSSKLLRTNECGYVDRIYRGRNGEGYSFVKIRVREERFPVIGDKFSSRHGQKGTCGLIVAPEDMPQTRDGIIPDLIINPHCIPSRMTIAQLMETLLGKIGCVAGCLGDATPFNDKLTAPLMADILQKKYGLEPYSNEILYCGYTGKQMETAVFMGPVFYQRLKHMVNDKIHCLTPDHDVLTYTGWKPIACVTREDKVATLQEGKIVYSYPNQTFAYDYQGPMYKIKNKDIDLKTTMNHRMWVATLCRDNTWEYGFHEAGDIMGKHVRYQKDGIYEENDYQFVLPSHKDIQQQDVNMEAWLTFFGIWFSYGFMCDAISVSISLSNQDRTLDTGRASTLKKCLRELGIPYSYYPISCKLNIMYMPLINYMKHLNVLTFPAWVWKLSAGQCRSLLYSMFSDASFSTFSQTLADDIQQLAFHAGWSASIQRVDSYSSTTVWVVKINTVGNRPVVNSGFDYNTSESVSDYDGQVYCLEVPGNVFYVRRNGISVWTGNSRATGPLVMLTRQPAEGRARDGGLRFGEMERDCLASHGTSAFLKERMMEASDNFEVHVCKGCGLIAVANKARNIWNCTGCGNTTEFSQVRIPYAYKLFLQELESMNVSSRILTETRLRALAEQSER